MVLSTVSTLPMDLFVLPFLGSSVHYLMVKNMLAFSFFFNFLFWCIMQTMKAGAKKAGVSDEWRAKNVEERLEYSLVKVRHAPVSSLLRKFLQSLHESWVQAIPSAAVSSLTLVVSLHTIAEEKFPSFFDVQMCNAVSAVLSAISSLPLHSCQLAGCAVHTIQFGMHFSYSFLACWWFLPVCSHLCMSFVGYWQVRCWGYCWGTQVCGQIPSATECDWGTAHEGEDML